MGWFVGGGGGERKRKREGNLSCKCFKGRRQGCKRWLGGPREEGHRTAGDPEDLSCQRPSGTPFEGWAETPSPGEAEKPGSPGRALSGPTPLSAPSKVPPAAGLFGDFGEPSQLPFKALQAIIYISKVHTTLCCSHCSPGAVDTGVCVCVCVSPDGSLKATPSPPPQQAPYRVESK